MSYHKKVGTYYVHWKTEGKVKRVDFFSTDAPTNLKVSTKTKKISKKKTVKKTPKKRQPKTENFDWLK